MHVQVAAAEVLLGVMEGLHVDNARIEFEGACEVRAARCVLRAALPRVATIQHTNAELFLLTFIAAESAHLGTGDVLHRTQNEWRNSGIVGSVC